MEEELIEIVASIKLAKEDVRVLLQRRDSIVAQRLKEGMSPARIAEIIGVSRQHVWEIGRKTKP